MPGFDPESALHALWAKSDRDGGSDVSLWEHSLAAGLAASVLLHGPLLPVAARLAQEIGADTEEATGFSAAMVALHDLGKATAAFQAQWAPGATRAAEAGLPMSPSPPGSRPPPHGFVSAGEIARDLERRGARRAVARGVARAIGAHHGTFPHDLPPADDLGDPEGRWAAVRAHLTDRILQQFSVGDVPAKRWSDVATALLAGLTTFADWLASDRSVLGELSAGGLGRDAVEAAIARVPLTTSPRLEGSAFAELFPFAPRGAQQIVDRMIVPEVAPDDPTLVVIEDATGAGKTEAAFQLAHRGLACGLRGIYVALPTQATSNQAYARLAEFLARDMPGVSDAQLLHSNALTTADFAAIRAGTHSLSPREVSSGDDGGEPGAIEAARWFAQGKRGLLGSYAVGTVDQAMVAVMRARFATLRLLGIAGKTLVLDEVHAYDTYMIAIIRRLVSWAGALGSNVVILSATLPAGMKRDLVEAFLGEPAKLADADARAYPSVTHVRRASGARVYPVEAAPQSRRSVRLCWLNSPAVSEPFGAVVKRAVEAVEAGAEVAVIMNTVTRAQAVFGALRPLLGDRARLFHARFRHRERQPLDDAVRALYGPAGARPGGSVLVATQVVEQSLDIDFDAMITDLAPVDLLLQRMGRLQRHDRHGSRPVGFDEDTCALYVLAPVVTDGVPEPDAGSRAVYGLHPLLRTWWALEGRGSVSVPDDVRDLVEAVYDERDAPHDFSAEQQHAWEQSAADIRRQTDLETVQAGNRVVGSPLDGDLASRLAGTVGDDDEPLPGAMASTRLGMSCTVVILRPDEAARLAGADARVPRIAHALVERSLSVAHPAMAGALLRQPVPGHWRRVPLMSRRRLVVLDENLRASVAGMSVRLDDELGVVLAWESSP